MKTQAEALETVLDFYKSHCPADQRCAETIETVNGMLTELEVEEEEEDEDEEEDEEETE